MPRELPISLPQARRATRWLMTHFGGSLRDATAGTPFSPALLCAIACQETAYFWLSLATRADDPVSPDEVVARCVLDASGDVPGTSRGAFPRNTDAFYDRYDRAFGDMLVREANATRALRGLGPKPWIYKGYGIFQYDLQFVVEDEGYFRFRQWRDFEVCLGRVMRELTTIHRRNGGDLWETVRAYNGGGQAARNYRDNVREFTPAAQAEIEAMESLPRGGIEAAPLSVATPRRRPARAGTRGKAKPRRPGPARPPAPADPVLRATALHSTTLPLPAARARAPRAAARSGEMPAARPRLSAAELAAKLAPFALNREEHPLVVVGIRGYYRDTMGAPAVNDRGMYDDALFIDTPDVFAAFNGNTDPSRFRPGSGFGEATKGIASLNPGVWIVYRFDQHNGKYLALCQRAGKVTVTRDGRQEDYEDTGNFGINIHRGSYHGTSSLGCQTLHPDQWESFIGLATDLARRYHGDRWKRTVIPYVLLENV